MDHETTAGKVEGSSRFSAALKAFSLDRHIRAARARERKLVTEAGASVVASTQLIDLPHADVTALRARISDVGLQINNLDLGLRTSLDKDRQDYAKASQLMKWIVVTRGALDRWILRDRIRFHRRERERLSHDLGVLVFDGAHDVMFSVIPDQLRADLAQTRTAIDAARGERQRLLAPWNGEALPPWPAKIAREIGAFLLHVWDHLSRRLFLRAPAIVALVASWWLAHRYTAGFSERLRHSLGLGGRAPMDPDTLQMLKFWVPLLSAALCTYLASVVAAHVQRKYALPKDR